jgi:hypothetical protein
VANDTLDGASVSESIRNRSKEAIKTLVDKANNKMQKGEGYKTQRRLRKKTQFTKRKKPIKRKKNSKNKQSKKQRTKLDIFDSL